MAKKMQEILKQALLEIKPSKLDEKQVMEKVNLVIKRINKNLKHAKAVLGGSGAKGTWLKSFDADVFVRFNHKKYRDKSGELSDILEKAVRKSFGKYDRLHGSRDYFQIKLNGFTVELVPILDIKRSKEAMNITDVSLLHVKWVTKHKKLADEIRLAKQFCKAAEVYGAESYIRGFSGYVAEILVVYYGGFINLIRNAVKWKDIGTKVLENQKVFGTQQNQRFCVQKITKDFLAQKSKGFSSVPNSQQVVNKDVIDVNKYYRNRNEALFNLNASKKVSPLIVIDPVQKDRNAAASLSKEKFERFKDACKEFLERPSIEFFRIKEFNIAELEKRKRSDKLIVFEGKALKGKKDIIGSKLLKVFEFLTDRIKFYDFKIIEKGWKWDNQVVFWFIVDGKELEPYKKHEGPMIKSKRHVERFKQKHKETFVEGKKIYAKVRRKYTKIEDLAKELVKEEYVKERMQKVWIR